MWWQPKETGTFRSPPSLCTVPETPASVAIPCASAPSCEPAVATDASSLFLPVAGPWQNAGERRGDSCSYCPRAVFLAAPGTDLFSELAPSPGERRGAGVWGKRGGCPPCPALPGQMETWPSAGEQQDQLRLPAPHLSQRCLGKERFF